MPVNWYTAYQSLAYSEANRQVNWDRLYASNKGANAAGTDAMYFVQAKRIDALNLQLNSVLNIDIDPKRHFTAGIGLGANHGRHYQTMEDLLGAATYHNINTYALSSYGINSPKVQYDLNNPNAIVREGDTFAYDYYINVRKANAWTAYTANHGSTPVLRRKNRLHRHAARRKDAQRYGREQFLWQVWHSTLP